MTRDRVSAKAVVRDGKPVLLDAALFWAQFRQMKLGEGEEVVYRLARPEDAYTYAQIKAYWGFIVAPFCDYTGYHKHEVHALLKTECMPDGKTSITELNHDELKAYTQAAEQTAREWCPDAFALHERISA